MRGMVRLGVSFTLLKWFNPRKIVRGEKAVRDLLPFTVVGKKWAFCNHSCRPMSSHVLKFLLVTPCTSMFSEHITLPSTQAHARNAERKTLGRFSCMCWVSVLLKFKPWVAFGDCYMEIASRVCHAKFGLPIKYVLPGTNFSKQPWNIWTFPEKYIPHVD